MSVICVAGDTNACTPIAQLVATDEDVRVETANSRWSHEGDSDQDGQEIHSCPEDDYHNNCEDQESPSGADEEKEGDEVDIITLSDHGPATKDLP